MKKIIYILAILSIGYTVQAQVGISNSSPQVTLDITANGGAVAKDGLLVPRVTSVQLSAKTILPAVSATYAAAQEGALVYVTDAAVGLNQASTVLGKGFYYFEASPINKWTKLFASTTSAGVPISSLLAATKSNDIDNLNFEQRWRWNTMSTFATGLWLDFVGGGGSTLTTGKALDIKSNAGHTGKLVDILSSGPTAAALKITMSTTTGGTAIPFTSTDGPGIELIANSVTDGTAFDLSTSNPNINSTRGIFIVRNSSTPTTSTGLFARFDPNNSSSGGLTVINDGKVGIGTSTPKSQLEVNGSVTNTAAYDAGASTSIDYSNSNIAYTTASAGAFTLSNMKDGGSYILNVRGATSGSATFSHTSPSTLTFKSVNNGPTTASTETMYTILVMGTVAYVYMTTGI